MMALESIKSKLQATLVGYRKNRYLIVERPSAGTTPLGLTEGTRWMVNFVREGDIYTFQSQVMGTVSRPIPLIFLVYPKEINRTSLRQADRIPVNLPVLMRQNSASNQEEYPTYKGLIRDISEGGCQVVTTFAYPIETLLQLTVVIDEERRMENVTAEVKSHQNLGERHVLGLSFMPGRTTDVYPRLVAFVEQLKSMPIRF